MKYFSDVGPLGLKATCSNCGVLTSFTGQNKIGLQEKDFHYSKYIFEYQCQDCGALKMADFDDPPSDVMQKRCECGGQFRRDKPLFCYSCKANKTELNRSE